MDILVLRFDAPLFSFGGPVVDADGVVSDFPARSMLTGLCANALGWSHRNGERLQRLQDRIRLAARCDRGGVRLVDFQTVDLGLPFMVGTGWTTRGVQEVRAGAKTTAEGTHIRTRHYLADAVYTVALGLDPEDDEPTLSEIEAAYRTPARPLFLGRRCCLPSSPILVRRLDATSLKEALADEARAARADEGPLRAWWPEDEEAPPDSRLIPVTDDRDWTNQIHAGRRFVREGRVSPPEVGHECHR